MNEYSDTQSPQQKERRPITGERAFEDTDATKHRKIVEYVNARKKEYFGSPEYKTYIKQVNDSKKLINQDTSELPTKFKMRFALMRAGYDNLIDFLDDIADVDDLITTHPEGSQSQEMSSDWQIYINRLLRSINYKQHLSERFKYLPDYGWSIAHDTYQFSNGWQVKPKAQSILPELEAFDFGMEEDVFMDRPLPEIVRPEHWFGSVDCGVDQPFQGTIKRWYLKDVYAAMLRKDKAGNPLYNVAELKKIADLMSRGWQDTDEFYKVKDSAGAADVEFKGDKVRGPYLDVIRFHGPLNEITDVDLSQDPNEYYVECSRTCLLRWQENPRDRYTTYTHMRTHGYRNNPFSRTHLDAMKPHQQFTDFLACMSAESITDNLTKHWAYWAEDVLDPDDFIHPKGLNAFLELQGQGRLPQLIGQERSGAFSDIKDLLVLFDRDRQRAGATDQELGVQGGTEDKTATSARLLAAATSKSKRATVKRIFSQAVIPQVKNLTMLSLVHGRPENRKIIMDDDGREKRLGGEHLKWWMRALYTDTQILVSDTITRNREEEATKINAFLQSAAQMTGQVPPDSMIKVLRLAGETAGINQAVIDDIFPPPLPVDVTMPDGRTVRLPSAAGMPMPNPMAPPAGPTPPQPQGGAHAPMVPPTLG